jgi:hypothetical protein
VYTDLGPEAADFEARLATLGADDFPDEGDGRVYYLWTDENKLSADLERRLQALGGTPVTDTSEEGKRYLVYTRLGEAAADLESRLALAAGQIA